MSQDRDAEFCDLHGGEQLYGTLFRPLITIDTEKIIKRQIDEKKYENCIERNGKKNERRWTMTEILEREQITMK